MHESAAGQDTQKSWPVGIWGFGLGVTDHPGGLCGGPAAAAVATPASAEAMAAAKIITMRRI
jgi:hypothetical protein